MKRITLCADDFSFSPGISKAIVALIKRDRLSATSCMVNTQHWSEHAELLKPFIKKVDIGLHFTLTDVKPALINLYKHPDIIKKAYFRNLFQNDIEKEIELQLEKFKSALGKLPNFIDGHQHIHQLPIIRDALLSVYKKTFPNKQCYIRVPIMKPATLKSCIITHTGGSALKKLLTKHDIPFNTSFSGVYNFSKANHYQNYFQNFIKHIQSGGIIMCHPGVSGDNKDCIAHARQSEFNYLNSKCFLDDCRKQKVLLNRLQEQILN